ncbi:MULTISPECIES: hypothetical protein [Bacteria]|uniref:hypothetical protein n=1 Tax=Bacteria TaxID=2 RepID=UPI003C7BC820
MSMFVAGCAGPTAAAGPSLSKHRGGISAAEREARAEAQRAEAAAAARQAAQVSVEPGVASCSFTGSTATAPVMAPSVGPDPTSGPDLGHPDRVEVREESDAYVVTYTGSFFAPDELLSSNRALTLSVTLHGGQPVGTRTLLTLYYAGRLSFTGTYGDSGTGEDRLRTGADLSVGTFTASYPKSSDNLAGFAPTMWTASVSLMTIPASESATRRVQDFRCGSGESWEWKPLAVQN